MPHEVNSPSSSDLTKGMQNTMGEKKTEFSLSNLYPVFNHWTEFPTCEDVLKALTKTVPVCAPQKTMKVMLTRKYKVGSWREQMGDRYPSLKPFAKKQPVHEEWHYRHTQTAANQGKSTANGGAGLLRHGSWHDPKSRNPKAKSVPAEEPGQFFPSRIYLTALTKGKMHTFFPLKYNC